MAKPTYIMLGVQKGGTEAARFHFNQHPEVFFYQHEAHFFDDKNKYAKGIKHYENLFNSPKPHRGEKSPDYHFLYYVIERIYKHYPEAKLFLLLREPISRAYSQYNMGRQVAFKNYDYNLPEYCKKYDHIAGKDVPDRFGFQCYTHRGYYIDHIEHILSMFPREQLHVAISEEIIADPFIEYNKMFQFLGVDPLPEENFQTKKNIHKRKYNREIPEDIYKYFYGMYKPYTERLYEFLGREVPAWETIFNHYNGKYGG